MTVIEDHDDEIAITDVAHGFLTVANLLYDVEQPGALLQVEYIQGSMPGESSGSYNDWHVDHISHCSANDDRG